MESIQIHSNITLHYIPMQKLKTTTVGVYLFRPLAKEEASMNALLPYVLKRGCGLYRDSAEIAKFLEDQYGAKLRVGVTKKGNNQTIIFETEAISDRYAPEGEPLSKNTLELLLSILLDPVVEDGAFNADFLAQEKTNAVARIEGLKNDKRTYAQMRCIEEVCKGMPYALSAYGDVSDMEQIDEKTLYEHYKSIISSSVIHVFVCGEANMEEMRKTIEEKTAGIKFQPAQLQDTPIVASKGVMQSVKERMEINQGKISVGFSTGIGADDPDYWALVVANSVFGAGTHSKLFNNVREKLSLAYYASSQMERFTGLLIVNAGIEFSNFQKAYDETMAQFEEVQKGNISDMEFESSINTIINSLNSYEDDQRMMRNFYVDQMIAKTGCDLEQYKAQILAVTKEDCVRVFRNVKPEVVYFLTGEEDAK